MSKVVNTRLGSLYEVPVFKVSDESEINEAKVLELIQKHQTYRTRYDLLYDYYLGKHIIQHRVVEEPKPNNKLVDNYAEYITSVKTGYFMGKPVSYRMGDNSEMEDLNKLFIVNDEEDVNSELAKMSSIFGHAFELLWMKDSEINFSYVSPKEMFMIYGRDVKSTPLGAVRYWTVGEGEEKKTKAVVYLSDRILELDGTDKDGLSIMTDKENVFQQVPVIEYKNNEERTGDFETVITLIDAYEIVMSDSVNEVQYFNDAYLVVRNLMMTEKDDISDMKNNRVIQLDEGGEAEWLVKNINDGHVQHVLDRIEKDIHKFSKTPNLTDESFSANLSGTAIKFKLWGLEQDAINKERKFKKGLRKRLQMLSTGKFATNKGSEFDWLDVRIKFTRNIPTNVLEQSQIVANVNGVVSRETLLSILSFVDNVNAEMEALEQEEQKNIENYGFNPEVKVNNTGTPNDGVTEKQTTEKQQEQLGD